MCICHVCPYKCYIHLHDDPAGPVRSPVPQPMQASNANNHAHPAGLVDVHLDAGTCSGVEKAHHDMESYIAVCTYAALDSIAPAWFVVFKNRELRCQKPMYEQLVFFQKLDFGFGFGYRNNSTKYFKLL